MMQSGLRVGGVVQRPERARRRCRSRGRSPSRHRGGRPPRRPPAPVPQQPRPRTVALRVALLPLRAVRTTGHVTMPGWSRGSSGGRSAIPPRVEAVVAGAGPGAGGAPNVVIVVSTTWASPSSAASGPTSTRRPSTGRPPAGPLRQLPHHGALLADPGLPADRAQPPLGRHGPDRGAGHRVPRLRRPHPGRRAAMLPEALRPRRATPPGRSASGTSRPRTSSTPGASRARWPLGRGFERFYGFFEGETHQFGPALVEDNHLTQQPTPSEDGYHLTEDLADHAIAWISDLRAVDDDKPFFAWFATGACHSPHQAPRQLDRRYAGRFDEGWDAWREADPRPGRRRWACCPSTTVLSERPDWVPAWASLSGDERRLYARYMEAFAGFLSHTDAQVGRIVDHLAGDGRPRQHDHRAGLRQRGQLRGRARRLDQRRATVERPAPRRSRRRSAASTRSAGPTSTTTTRGAGPSPATRRSAAGSGRSTRAASPTR